MEYFMFMKLWNLRRWNFIGLSFSFERIFNEKWSFFSFVQMFSLSFMQMFDRFVWLTEGGLTHYFNHWIMSWCAQFKGKLRSNNYIYIIFLSKSKEHISTNTKIYFLPFIYASDVNYGLKSFIVALVVMYSTTSKLNCQKVETRHSNPKIPQTGTFYKIFNLHFRDS